MDSGPLGLDDSREKHWDESKNVSSRKIQRKGPKKPNGGFNAPPRSLPALGTTGEGDRRSSRFGGASDDDSSSLNRPNRATTGVVKVDRRVRIRDLSRMSKGDVREIRRKLVAELDRVRVLVKKLESGEVQLSTYSAEVSATEQSEKGGGGLRVNSEVGSVGMPNSRPSMELSVSVIENESSHGVSGFGEKDKRTDLLHGKDQLYQKSNLLLGKDGTPPLDSNKKFKKNKKHEEEVGHEYVDQMDKQMRQAIKNCNNLLGKLMKHKLGWVFNTPVDVKGLGLHDYYTIIKHPMDLGTVKSRLSKNWYKSPEEFAEDVRLTFRNAMTYNPKGQDVYVMAEVLLKLFEEKWVAIEAEVKLGMKHGIEPDSNLPAPILRKALPSLPLLSPSEMGSVGRFESISMPIDSNSKPTKVGRPRGLTKPKAKDPDKRDMTYEEKQMLSTNLQNLPSDKLDNIVQIIKKRNSALSQHDDEIEVDIDNVDAETLWELDRFITNYKKSLTKNKKKAEISLQVRPEDGHAIEETIPSVAMLEPPKETETGENAVSTSLQREMQVNNVSQSSNSSSSSSDSEPSSSDSDNDSSSLRGSDGGHHKRMVRSASQY